MSVLVSLEGDNTGARHAAQSPPLVPEGRGGMQRVVTEKPPAPGMLE